MLGPAGLLLKKDDVHAVVIAMRWEIDAPTPHLCGTGLVGGAGEINRASVLAVPSTPLMPDRNVMHDALGHEDGRNFIVPTRIGTSRETRPGWVAWCRARQFREEMKRW